MLRTGGDGHPPGVMRRLPYGRIGCAVAVAAALARAPSAAAGDRVVLPPGESATAWETALAIAGLELASGGSADGTTIRIDPAADGWIVRAEGAGGIVRTARVDPPSTAAEREDVALLARGLAQAVTVAAPDVPSRAPPEVLPPLPPPPPPPPAPRAEPLPGPPPPPVSPPAAVVAEPAAAEVIVIRAAAPPPEAAPAEPPSRALVLVRRLPRERAPLQVPPIRLASGAAFRGPLAPGFVLALGVDVARVGKTTLGWDLTVVTARDLQLGFERRFVPADVTVAFALPLRRFEVGGRAGVSWRTYRQQFAPVDQGPLLVAGGRGGVAFVDGRWIALALDLDALVDLGPTRLFREDGSSVLLFPLEVRTALRVELRATRDPFPRSSTSPE